MSDLMVDIRDTQYNLPIGTDTISRAKAIDICDHAIDLLKGQFGAGALVAIKESIEELPPAQPEPDQNGDLWITVPDIDKVTRIYVQESKSKFCRIFYEDR